jgi:hypothetical protein
LQDVHPSLLKYIHLSAAPRRFVTGPESLRAEERGGRSYPAEGEYRLVKLLNAHPAGIPTPQWKPESKAYAN